MNKQEVLNSVSELKSKRGGYKSKCERNIRLYEDTLNIDIDSVNTENVVGFYKDGSAYDTTVDISLNIIKSCIDTLTSKVAAVKVRPFFNTVNGSFKDVRIVKQAQQYFDESFEYKNINKVVSTAFKNACIFDTGVIYVDPLDKTIKSVLPWQVYFRPSEMTYGKLTRIYYEMKQYPTCLIDGYNGKEDYIAYGRYYDLTKKTWAELFSDGKVKIYKYDSPVLPFVFIHYSRPIVGSTSNSITDMLLPIQVEINALMNKIKDASQLSPANTILVPEGSGINVRKLNNGIGQIIGYKPPLNGGGQSPITVATPSFIDPNYMALLDELKQTAYELVGISQLSASSQKPTGLNSGIALQSLENIESDRFQVQMNQVLRAYTEIAKTCMKVYDPEEDILPEDQFRSTIKWMDIVDEEKNMKVSFSSADALSKDPSTKLQILQSLAQSGIIPASTIGKYLEIPDLEKGYSVINNSWNAVQTVIERCINENIFEVPSFVPYDLLQQEIINTCLSLYNADPVKNTDDINKLMKLFEVVMTGQSKVEEFTAKKQAEEQQMANAQAMDQMNMEEGV